MVKIFVCPDHVGKGFIKSDGEVIMHVVNSDQCTTCNNEKNKVPQDFEWTLPDEEKDTIQSD